MIFEELHTAFRWYNSLSKQNRFKEQCTNMCDFKLITPCNDILPFQIRSDSFDTPQSWTLVYLGDPIDIPQVAAKAVFCLPETGTAFSIAIDGYGTIATSAMLGSVATTVASMVSQINAGGTFYAFGHNNCIYVIAPLGEAWNGVNTSLGITYAMFSTLMEVEFSGASDQTTGNTIDITTCIPFLNTYDVGDKVYVEYNGEGLPGCMPQQMVCGQWYSIISDGAIDLFSEVFEVVAIEDIPFEQSILPLFSAWRWHDSIEKQNSNKEYCQGLCNFYLLSSNTELLPFQIRTLAGTTGIQSWKLVSVDGDCEYLLDTSLVTIVTTNSHGKRIIYNGADVDLPCGKFYSVLDDGVTIWYSEPIEITDAFSLATEGYLQTDDGINLTNDDGVVLTID